MKDGQLTFASGIATVSAGKGRFALPRAVVDAWKLGAADRVLVAELRGPGHLRLHRPADGKVLREAAFDALRNAGLTAKELQWRARIIQDKFRDISFYASDRNRVALPPELVIALIGELPKLKVYVDADEMSIDVMAQQVRLQRLVALEDEDE